MKTRAALVLAAIAGSATTVNAQVRAWTDAAHLHPVHVVYTFVASSGASGNASDYLSVNSPNYTVAGNNNGVIDPNEGGAFKIIATVKSDTGTNLVMGNLNTANPGTPIFFDSTIQTGTTGVGQLASLWSGSWDLVGNNGALANGTWVVSSQIPLPALALRWGLVPPYAIGAGNGTSANSGSRINNVLSSNFGADVTGLNSNNPTGTVWRALWIPASFSGQTITWQMVAASVGTPGAEIAVQDDNGGTVPVALSTAADYASKAVAVATPTPSSLALLGLGGLVAARRRRR